jgi:hypothetical protein
MRIKVVSLLVAYVGCHVALELVGIPILSRQLGADAAEGAPIAATAVSEDIHRRQKPDTLRSSLAAQEHVTVRVYDAVNLAADGLRAALDVAQVTFHAASVDVVWTNCGPGQCDTPPSPAELILRFVRSPEGARRESHCLGDALIDAQKGAGVLATVYVDRIRQLSSQLHIDDRTLLGRTIAHEIGHLLLATNTHGPSGLMREMWSPKELRRARPDDWTLHSAEVTAIHERLALSRSERLNSTS